MNSHGCIISIILHNLYRLQLLWPLLVKRKQQQWIQVEVRGVHAGNDPFCNPQIILSFAGEDLIREEFGAHHRDKRRRTTHRRTWSRDLSEFHMKIDQWKISIKWKSSKCFSTKITRFDEFDCNLEQDVYEQQRIFWIWTRSVCCPFCFPFTFRSACNMHAASACHHPGLVIWWSSRFSYKRQVNGMLLSVFRHAVYCPFTFRWLLGVWARISFWQIFNPLQQQLHVVFNAIIGICSPL